jgi:hypothetical protein
MRVFRENRGMTYWINSDGITLSWDKVNAKALDCPTISAPKHAAVMSFIVFPIN